MVHANVAAILSLSEVCQSLFILLLQLGRKDIEPLPERRLHMRHVSSFKFVYIR